jgi:hypothetical protein
MCNPRMQAIKMHIPEYLRIRDLDHLRVDFSSNHACRNEKPAWNRIVAKRNSIAPSHLKEKPGGRSQNGSVVPTNAGSREAVQ